MSFFSCLGSKKPKFILPTVSSSSSSSSNGSDSDTPLPHPDPPPTKKPPPPHHTAPLSAANLALYREDFPHLRNKPDSYFSEKTFEQLIRMNTMLEKSSKSNRKLTERLSRNLDFAKTHPTQVPAGPDNRSDLLHSARFLGGHLCKHTTVWLQARGCLGLQGPDPVSRYDIDALGLGGHINTYVWAALTNPGSKDLSIGMMAPEALRAARGTEDRDSHHPKRAFSSVDALRTALSALRAALHCIHPWNFSLTALEFFLTTIRFGTLDLPDHPNRLSIVTEFIDDVLLYNAEAWDDARPFLQFADLSTRWLHHLLPHRSSTPSPAAAPSQPARSKPQPQSGAHRPPPLFLCVYHFWAAPTAQKDEN